VSVVLVPAEPSMKPRRRVVLKVKNREYCAEENTIHHGHSYIAFVDCNGNYIVVPVAQPA